MCTYVKIRMHAKIYDDKKIQITRARNNASLLPTVSLQLTFYNMNFFYTLVFKYTDISLQVCIFDFSFVTYIFLYRLM